MAELPKEAHRLKEENNEIPAQLVLTVMVEEAADMAPGTSVIATLAGDAETVIVSPSVRAARGCVIVGRRFTCAQAQLELMAAKKTDWRRVRMPWKQRRSR